MPDNKTETINQFLERLFFDIFMDCIVIRDTKLFDFSMLYNILDTKNFPIQISALIKSIKEDSKNMDNIQLYNKYFFIMYMNYKNLFKVEYYDDMKENWFILTETVLNTFKEDKLLCRVVSFINEKIGVIRSEDIDIPLVNQYFIMSNK